MYVFMSVRVFGRILTGNPCTAPILLVNVGQFGRKMSSHNVWKENLLENSINQCAKWRQIGEYFHKHVTKFIIDSTEHSVGYGWSTHVEGGERCMPGRPFTASQLMRSSRVFIQLRRSVVESQPLHMKIICYADPIWGSFLSPTGWKLNINVTYWWNTAVSGWEEERHVMSGKHQGEW